MCLIDLALEGVAVKEQNVFGVGHPTQVQHQKATGIVERVFCSVHSTGHTETLSELVQCLVEQGKGAAVAAVHAGALVALRKSMTLHKRDIEATAAACGVIACLAEESWWIAEAGVRVGLHDQVLGAMRSCRDTELHSLAAAALWALAANSSRNRALFVEKQVWQDLLLCLRLWPQEESLVMHALGALFAVVQNDSEAQASLVLLGVSALLSDLTTKHRDAQHVLTLVFRLGALIAIDSTRCQSQLQQLGMLQVARRHRSPSAVGLVNVLSMP
mmetsp:Transcript_1003/g.1960  ORF Transcript_1003/g.1960 Transcript_1003/m.1960 type:complete len:273 (+) Transcript_1003:358-1176(+)